MDPAWQVELSRGRARAKREGEGGSSCVVEVELPDVLLWVLERQSYYPTFGYEVDRFVLVGVGSHFDEATTRFRCID
jgi:hypothetical protein